MKRRQFMRLLGGVAGAIPGAAMLASLGPRGAANLSEAGVSWRGVDYSFDRQSYFVVVTRWHERDLFVDRMLEITEEELANHGGSLDQLLWERLDAPA